MTVDLDELERLHAAWQIGGWDGFEGGLKGDGRPTGRRDNGRNETMRDAQQQDGPWGDTLHGGPWTRHGHPIPDKTVIGEIPPPSVGRCGGVALCRTCQADAEAAS